jgi:2',3'-cyclic-nucleotide 2'-phosphodiesterase (5'-nucleotidase family)
MLIKGCVKMKQKWLLILLLILGLASCSPSESIDETVDCNDYPNHVDCVIEDDDSNDPIIEDFDDQLEIFYINDLHGALAEDGDELGLAKIANLIQTRRTQSDGQVLFLGGGDLLQGSALSNYYNGLSTIELLNEMGMDAMTIGNHEFDWGLDTVLAYRDGNLENGEADFPFLGANIFYEDTNDIPNYVDPYIIIEKGSFKIGIIGTIGDTLESSIATSRVEGYEFRDSVSIIADYSAYLRTVEDCNVIISMAHESGYINPQLTRLEGDERIDFILNAHSHQITYTTIGGVPQLQSGSNGEAVGYIHLTIDDGVIENDLANLNAYSEPLLQTPYQPVADMIEVYVLETYDLFNEPIISSSSYYRESDLSLWLTKLINTATNSDISFHNYGGTRAPLESGEMITRSTLYDIWPFDNTIKTVYLTGTEIEYLINASQLAYYTEHTDFEADTLYKVATNDYVFDKPSNPFINGTDITITPFILRDFVEQELILQSELYTGFSIENDILSIPTTN